MNTRKVPKLRFPEFSNTNENNDFTNNRFDDIFNFSTGKNIKQSEASPDFEIPCVRYGELYHIYDEVVKKIVNKTNLDRDNLKFSHGDEILLPSAGEDPLDIGSASALTIKNIAIGRTINILRPKQETKISQIFVSYYINQRLRRKIATLAKGVSISNVYNSDLKKLKINLPSYTEQQKIADFLSSVDQKIQQLRRKKELLEEYKKGVMQKLFSQEIRFKDENGEDFPDWEFIRGGNVFKSHSNKNHNGNLPLLAATQDQGVVTREKADIDVNVSMKSIFSYKIVEPGDFVISLRSFQGGIEYSEVKGICSPAYIILKPKRKIHDDFFRYYFKKESFIERLSKTVVGIRDGKQISYNAFSGVKLKVPSYHEQSKIADFLNSIQSKIDLFSHKVNKAEKFKKGLLQQMFV